LEGWAYALALRCNETENHTLRVVDLTLQIAKEMGVSDDQRVMIRYGDMLYDIGKLGIPDAVLRKPSAQDEEELKVMRTIRRRPLRCFARLNT
jgi:response regulator RpfG family c-di-GMP phosphodiesterase